MNGNKPSLGLAPGFTTRMAAHSRIAYMPYPDPAAGDLLVTMVIDEILVGAAAAADNAVTTELTNRGATKVGSVYGDFGGAGPNEDVEIWRLDSTPGDKPHPDVAEAVWAVRAVMPGTIQPEQVAPNHVLVPAPDYHMCPDGPPGEQTKEAMDLGAGDGSVHVTVIDAGYQNDGPIRNRADAAYGEWFTASDATPPTYSWQPETPTSTGADPFDEDGDTLLDALVAHANFVAGVVAQACPFATINILSHNAGFIERADTDAPFPTEASVARSLWRCLKKPEPGEIKPDVINVGFAFATLPTGPSTAATDPGKPPSWSFKVALTSVPDRDAVVIVAPAGNQRSPVPQYPAAFHGSYPNVVGVGSLGLTDRSTFSNYGPWVACCTQGENVVSTFIDYGGQTEDPEQDGSQPSKGFSGWASWNGTSFAAPKVAGQIAGQMVALGKTPVAAWNDLTAGVLSPPEFEMGFALSGLPPT